ncbi:MAG: type II restriction enzyme (Eco47II, Sau96I) [uncultured bacterium]|nr:MAG: type II restriction enzyme (Eco47II, Sau96I) [uncultured bacterium]
MQTIYKEQQLLSFITNEKLFSAVETIFKKTQNMVQSDKAFYRNSVDPFSAVFDASSSNITLEQWVNQEKARQRQKTLQNAIGEFHEEIIGSVAGWERLPVGRLIDVRNMSRKTIGEIKNKHNTTKGSDKKDLYDNLEFALNTPEYKGFTGYYVEVIPKNGLTYNKIFTPSDNKVSLRRPENENIRIIDGCSFYDFVTGDEHALERLYKVLPIVISDCLGVSKARDYSSEQLFHELFAKAFIR